MLHNYSISICILIFHSAVLKCNNGLGKPILRLCEATSWPIPSNSKVSVGLLAEQKIYENDKMSVCQPRES